MILDNFRIGGIQRLALDQLFALSDLKTPVLTLYRKEKATQENPNFLALEKERITQKKLLIQSMPEKNFMQILMLIRTLKKNNFTIIINHSVETSALLWIAKFFSGKKVLVKTFIHQLPTLSAPLQRLKRFIYASTTNELYAYSFAVVQDWNKRLNKNFLSKKILGSKLPQVLRNGIYLERLPKKSGEYKLNTGHIRLVFIGRGITWKNSEYIITTLRRLKNKKISALLVLPSIPLAYREALQIEFGEKIEFQIGKKIEDIVFTHNDIGVYPVDYGKDARFIESVSLNCLELACLGIPSLVSKFGTDTWPELEQIGIIRTVDWHQSAEFDSAIWHASQLNIDLHEIRSLVSIENNLKNILCNRT